MRGDGPFICTDAKIIALAAFLKTAPTGAEEASARWAEVMACRHYSRVPSALGVRRTYAHLTPHALAVELTRVGVSAHRAIGRLEMRLRRNALEGKRLTHDADRHPDRAIRRAPPGRQISPLPSLQAQSAP